MRFSSPTAGSITTVATQIPQSFHRIHAVTPADAIEARFRFFIDEVIPQLNTAEHEGKLFVRFAGRCHRFDGMLAGSITSSMEPSCYSRQFIVLELAIYGNSLCWNYHASVIQAHVVAVRATFGSSHFFVETTAQFDFDMTVHSRCAGLHSFLLRLCPAEKSL